MIGAYLERLADHVDYYVAPVYRGSREAVVVGYETVAGSAGDVSVHAGVLPGHPHIDDAKTVVDGLNAAGSRRAAFNYGYVPDNALEWVGTTTADYR